jgi:hypothetical protein
MRKLLVAAAASAIVGLGVVTAPSATAAPVAPTVVAPQTTDTVLFAYVASTSQRTLRMCDLSWGYGFCNNVAPGHWSKLVTNSIRVPAGCELWESGARKAQRKDHDWWWNSVADVSKRTFRASNCR